MKQESGTYVFMTLDKSSQERLLVFGIMAATETANEGVMHAGRMVQEMKDELSEAERTLLAIKEWTARLIGCYTVQTSE